MAVDVDKSVYICKLISYYDSMLNERQREILSLHYDEDLSLSEIAESCNITRQGVSQILKKGEEELFELEGKLGILRRTEAILEICNELDNVCPEISEKIKKQLL